MTSVCTGTLVYAAAGLFIGRKATTHWVSLDLLPELDPTIIPDVSSRIVDDGDLITSAGVSARIDMALHLVAGPMDPEGCHSSGLVQPDHRARKPSRKTAWGNARPTARHDLVI